jgi:hypothetical protein
MAGCTHKQGSYPAEVVYEGDKPVYQQYRCRSCDIIVMTKKL